MLLKIQVKPNAGKDEISRMADGSLKVKIRAQAVEGRANERLVEFFSEILAIPKSKIALVKGASSTYKTLTIDADETVVRLKFERAMK